MNIYRHKTLWKLLLLITAVTIGLISLMYTNRLVKKLKAEERKKVELWAEATRQIISASDSCQNLEFLLFTIESNTTVPVIWTDEEDNIIAVNNFDDSRSGDARYLTAQLKRMKEKTEPMLINLPDGVVQKVYFRDSTILRQLILYPYIQLSVIMLFILVSYLAFSASRKAEQNQVWVGMSKETAHQLGTPTSSLAGWLEILRIRHPGISITDEISRDVSRLEKVTERFSKIGSRPRLSRENLTVIISQTIDYLKSRTSSKVTYRITPDPPEEVMVSINGALIGWVIENVCKNAVDATGGEGMIKIDITETAEYAVIDVTDNGKGMPKSSFRKIFRPGYTTKASGWGLGLSLARRIVEEYHHGKIFVKHSEPGRGTCIRILLRKIDS